MKRVWFDASKGVIVVEGARATFPARSLAVTSSGSFVTIWLADAQTAVVADTYDRLANFAGQPFASLQAALAYLEGEFAKGGIPDVIDGGNF